jgi:hypothetical protein
VNEKLTRVQFHELLHAYMGARDHLAWVDARRGSKSEDYKVAFAAATHALVNLDKAVFES